MIIFHFLPEEIRNCTNKFIKVSLTQNDNDVPRQSLGNVSWESVNQHPRHHQSCYPHEWTYSASGMSAEPSEQHGENLLQAEMKQELQLFLTNS